MTDSKSSGSTTSGIPGSEGDAAEGEARAQFDTSELAYRSNTTAAGSVEFASDQRPETRFDLRGVVKDVGFDEITRELITGTGNTSSNPAANYYRIARDPQNLAETTAQLFFGIRMQCAKCHNHPFERWTQDDYYSMAAFFARVRQKKDNEEPGPNPQAPGAEARGRPTPRWRASARAGCRLVPMTSARRCTPRQ